MSLGRNENELATRNDRVLQSERRDLVVSPPVRAACQPVSGPSKVRAREVWKRGGSATCCSAILRGGAKPAVALKPGNVCLATVFAKSRSPGGTLVSRAKSNLRS